MNEEILSTLTSILEQQNEIMKAQVAVKESAASARDRDWETTRR